MKIVHVIHSLDPDGGGPVAVVVRLAAAQAASGDQVTILSGAHPDSAERTAKSLRGIPGIDQVRRVDVPSAGELRQLVFRPSMSELRAAAGEADFFHLHGIWNTLMWSAADAAVAADVPYALMLHGMLDPWPLSQKRLKKNVARRLRVGRLLDQAAFIHALTEDEAAAARDYRVAAPIRIVPNGVFLEELTPLPDPGAFVASHPSLRGRRYALFMGRLHIVKGLDYLAEAFAVAAPQLPDVDLVVAGPDGGERANFERKIGELGLTARVHIVGPIYGPAKLEALAGAACFVQPSRQEAFSMSIVEALACGVPAVVTRTCRFPAVESQGAGRVAELDGAAVGNALVDVLSDEKRRVEMGRRGRELALANYTWPRIAEQMRGFYQQAIPQRA